MSPSMANLPAWRVRLVSVLSHIFHLLKWTSGCCLMRFVHDYLQGNSDVTSNAERRITDPPILIHGSVQKQTRWGTLKVGHFGFNLICKFSWRKEGSSEKPQPASPHTPKRTGELIYWIQEFKGILGPRNHPAISPQWEAGQWRKDWAPVFSPPPLWPWADHSTIQNLGFLICKTGIITRPALLGSQGDCDNQVRK